MVQRIDNDAAVSKIKYPSLTKKLRRRSNFLVLFGILLILIVSLPHIFHSFVGSDAPKCRTIYMYPSYARIDGFDKRYTKLAKKYHLYLYREQGKDKEPAHGDEIQLDGVPILFIPGNAGSFKQVRSIAAASANVFFDARSSIQNPNTKNLDYFTADFNEDFTAFHGQTMLDQAEYLNDAVRYILSLYSQSKFYRDSGRPLPKAVILLGHSMGGIVARLMPTLPNHMIDSVNSIFTLSSPHSAAPVTFDGDILNLYDRINLFWQSSYEKENGFFRNNMSLISITGGILDDVLPADYTNLHGLIPETNGFSTFTSTIPEVWTPIDHLAIVWCDQLRYVLAKLLLSSVDDSTSTKTRDLKIRMNVARKYLLSGLEQVTMQDKSVYKFDNSEFSEFPYLTSTEASSKILFNSSNQMAKGHVFKLPQDSSDTQFTFLTSLHNLKLYFCENNNTIYCTEASYDMSKIPRSTSETEFPTDSSLGSKLSSFKFLESNNLILEKYDLIYLEKVETRNDDFILAEVKTSRETTVVDNGPWSLLFSNLELKANADSISAHFKFPKLWSSLISYRLKLNFEEGIESNFKPLVRQFIENQFETKWLLYPSNESHDINMHNVSPFIPFDDTIDSSLNLMVLKPPNIKITLNLSINWSLTFKMLLIRYRLAIASFPISVIAMVLAYQFFYYQNAGSKFISFDSALTNILNKYGALITLILSFSSPIINNKMILRFLFFIDPVSLNQPELNKHTWSNYYLLGLRESFMWWLPAFFFIISVALLFLLLRFINAMEFLAFHLWKLLNTYKELDLSQTEERSNIIWLFNKRQMIGICILFICVIFYIPYQFAFLIVSSLQIWSCLKTSILNQLNQSKYSNIHNFNTSFLMLTIFMIPINAPIVVVFLRNFAIRWETAFRSHHNFLAIAPTLLLTQRSLQLRVPSFSSRTNWLIVLILLSYMSFYSVIYGIRNLYWVYHLYNILNGILFIFTIN